jgi:hypothetical protein
MRKLLSVLSRRCFRFFRLAKASDPQRAGPPAPATIEPLEERCLLSADWKFVVFADSRNSSSGVDTAILTELAHQAVAEGAQFVLFPGDLAGSGSLSHYQTWQNAMSPAYDAGIGVYPVIGNHDLSDVNDFKSLFIQPQVNSGLFTTDAAGRSFAFTYNNALFLGLDTYESGNTDRVNQAFVDQQLAARDPAATPLVFAFGHEPAFRCGPDQGLELHPAQRNAFWSSLENAGAWVYFAGHDHLYDHLQMQDRPDDGNPNNGVHQFTVGTAGAPLYSYGLSGDMGNWTPVEKYHESQYGYVLVDVAGTTVTITWKHRTGSGTYAATGEVFSYTVTPPIPVLTANNDTARTSLNTPITVDVLANDVSPDGGTLSVTGVTQPANGRSLVNQDNTITYTPNAGYYGPDPFTYTISDDQGGTATATVEAMAGLTVTIGTGQAAKAWFTDADGTGITLTQTGGGTARLCFADGTLQSQVVGGIARITGPAAPSVLDKIVLSNTTSLSGLSLATDKGGDGLAEVGQIVGDRPMGSVLGQTTDLDAAVTMSGLGYVARLALHDLKPGAGITMAATGPASVAITTGWLEGGNNVVLGSLARSVQVAQWTSGSLQATSVGALSVTGDKKRAVPLPGDIGADVTLSGPAGTGAALGWAAIAGTVTGGAWSIRGRAGTVTIARAVNNWTLQGLDAGDPLTGVGALLLGNVTGVTVDVRGAVGMVRSKQWNSGTIHADTIASLRTLGDRLASPALAGDFAADVALDGPVAATLNALGSASIAGAISGGTWRITGAAGAIIAKSAAVWSATMLGDRGTIASLTLSNTAATSSFSVTARSIGTVNVLGSLSNAHFAMNQAPDARMRALTSFMVGGAFDDSEVITRGNIGTIILKTLARSRIFASVKEGQVGYALPSGTDDFDSPDVSLLATIQNVRILGVKVVAGSPAVPSLINSSIAAGTINSVSLVGTVADQDDTPVENIIPFGIATRRTMKSYRGPASGSVGDYVVRVI